MSNVCKHEFESRDPHKPGYSLIEYDLYAWLDLSLRKNLETDRYEIYNLSSGEVQYTHRRLEDIVRACNLLEGAENTKIRCGPSCSKQKKHEVKEDGYERVRETVGMAGL